MKPRPSAPVRLLASALIALAALAPARSALAQKDDKQAQVFFVEGMQLMNKKRYAEACEKFARSQELDPGMGTQYRLAECYEKLGRLASAYDQFMAVAEAAKTAKKPDRESVARKRAAALEVRVAKLTIEVPPKVASLPDLEVRRDGAVVGKDLWGTPIPVDSGDHVVTATARGKKPWEAKVWAEGTSKLLVSVTGLEDIARPVAKPVPKSMMPAIVLGAVGGVGVVLGATFVGLRAAQIGEAKDIRTRIAAKDGTCSGGGTEDFVSSCRSLKNATSTGDTFGTVSLVSFIVGGAAVAGMVTYLLIPAPKAERPAEAALRWSPVLGVGEGGVVVHGSF